MTSASDRRSRVAIVRTPPQPTDAEIEASVHRAIGLAGGLGSFVRPGATVLVKPNLVVVPPSANAGVCTHPAIAKAVADAVTGLGARAIIAEASAPGNDTEQALSVMGYDRLRNAGYELVDLVKTPTVRVPLPGGSVWTELTTFELAMKADAIISLPVLKTHCQAYVTLSLKNLMGLATSEQKPGFHRRELYGSLCDINALYRPRFAIVDGIIGQEGLGPTAGYPVHANLLMAGSDLVAVDSVCARVMGFEPKEVPLLRLAAERGLGTLTAETIEVVGESIASVRRRFMRAEEDPRALADGEIIAQGPETCLGCRNSIAAAFLMLEAAGDRNLAQGYSFLCAGADRPDGVEQERIIPVGRCSPVWMHELPGFVEGCPPRSSDIAATLRSVA